MNDTATNDDQSMEDILQSIKRIIADDEQADDQEAENMSATNDTSPSGSDAAASAAQETSNKETDDGVLELDDVVEDTTAAPTSSSDNDTEDDGEAKDYAPLDEVFGKRSEANNDDEASSTNVAQETPSGDDLSGAEDDILSNIDSLLNSETVAVSANALDSLKELTPKANEVSQEPLNIPSIPLRSGTTLEDLVVEALTPELRQWLNTYLPEIVERMVAAEIKKITDK